MLYKMMFRIVFAVYVFNIVSAYDNPWEAMNHQMRTFEKQLNRQIGDLHSQLASMDGPFFPASSSSELEKEFNPDAVMVDKPSRPFGLSRFPFFNFPLPVAWWNGPNVCIEKEQIEGNENTESAFGRGTSSNSEMFFSNNVAKTTSCHSTDTIHVCTTKIYDDSGVKKYIVKHHCCPGFRRDPNGPGCIQITAKSMADTLKENGGQRFLSLAQSSGLLSLLESANVTVFCPLDAALLEYEASHTDNTVGPNADTTAPKVVRRREVQETSAVPNGSHSGSPNSAKDDDAGLVEAHVVHSYFLSGELEFEQPILQTANSKVKIRINKYYSPHKVITANCVPLVSSDHFSNRGVAHMVNRVIPAAQRTLGELVRQDPELSEWRKVLESHHLMDRLDDPTGNWTLLAPVNQAFTGEGPFLASNLKTRYPCVDAIVRAHLSREVLCSAAVSDLWNFRTLTEDKNIPVVRRDDNLFFGTNSVVIKKDVMASNGVLYTLDKVIIPDEAKRITDVLRDRNHTAFLDLVERAGLKDHLEGMANFTVFAPTNEALERSKVQEIKDAKALKELVLHHIARPQVKTHAIRDGMMLQTQEVGEKGDKLHVSVQRLFSLLNPIVSVECGLVLAPEINTCSNGTLHAIDKVLVPTRRNLLETLQDLPQASQFNRLVRNLTSFQKLLANDSASYTLLVPVDGAFDRLSDRHIRQLETDPQWAESVLAMHLIPGRVCGSTVTPSSFFLFGHPTRTLRGHTLQLSRDRTSVKFGTARVVQSDLPATNGVIQLISQVLAPPRRILPNFADNFFTMFF